MAEKEVKKEKEEWVVGLTIVDENQPPLKVFQKKGTEETLDMHGMLATIKNDLDELKGLL